MDYLVIQPDGTVEERIVDAVTLELLQQEVGQDVEVIKAPDGLAFVPHFAEQKVDYNGRRLTLNAKGTRLLDSVLWPGTNIVGPLVLTGLPDAEGNVTSLDRETADEVMHRLAQHEPPSKR